MLPLSAAVAQQYTPPPPKLDAAPCVPTKKDPCLQPATPASVKERIPFPGDQATPGNGEAAPLNHAKDATDAEKANPFPGDPEPAKPGQAKSAPANSAAANNPFPGEPDTSPDAAAGSSSSSSSASGSSVGPKASTGKADDPDSDPDTGDDAPIKRHSDRRRLPKVAQSLDDREAEDLDVAHTYYQLGNYQAAYLRSQDAVKSIPDDPDAHFALALAARQLKKTDEAIAEFKTYLTLEPDGFKARQARQSLVDLAQK